MLLPDNAYAIMQTRLQEYQALEQCRQRSSKPATRYPMQQSLTGMQIKLLRVEHGDYADDLVCYLRVASLEDDYECLSYCWGDAHDLDTIRLNDQEFTITHSLSVALRHFRGVRDLWVDAVCINQEDAEEVACQISMMREIYTKAKGVRVWLGYPYQVPMTGMLAALHALQAPESTLLKDEEWTQFATLFEQPYWCRVWILQEIALSRSLVLFYGPCSIHMSVKDIMGVMRKCYYAFQPIITGGDERHPTNVRLLRNFANIIQTGLALWTAYEIGRGVEAQPLNLLEGRQTSRVHDHIFGILGLLRLDIAADYSTSWLDVVSDFTYQLIARYQAIYMLGSAGANPCFPTWVIDPSSILTNHINPFTAETSYQACGPSTFFIRRERKRLTVRGLIMDKVRKSVTSPLKRRRYTPQSLEPVSLAQQEAYISGILQTYSAETNRDGETQSQLLRTLLRDSAFKLGLRFGPELTIADLGEYAAAHNYPAELRRRIFLDFQVFDFFMTESGRPGGAKGTVKDDDLVVIISSCPHPFVIREAGNAYALVGSCYLDGIMYGEAVEDALKTLQESDSSRTFTADDVFTEIQLC